MSAIRCICGSGITVLCAYLERQLGNAEVEKHLECNHVDTVRVLCSLIADGDTSRA